MPDSPELKAKVSLDGSKFEAGARNVQAKVGDLKNSFTALKGAVIAAASFEVVRAYARLGREAQEAAGHIKDLSEQTGVAVDRVQRIDRAAKGVGLSFEDFAKGLEHLGEVRKQAVEEGGDAMENFLKWKVTLKDLQNPLMENVDLWEKLHKAMQDLPKTSENREMQRFFLGKVGPKLMNMQVSGGPVSGEVDASSIELLDRMGKQVEEKKAMLKGLLMNAFAFFADPSGVKRSGIDVENAEARLKEHIARKGAGELYKLPMSTPSAVETEEIKEARRAFNFSANQLQSVGAFVGISDRLLSESIRSNQYLAEIARNSRGSSSGGTIDGSIYG